MRMLQKKQNKIRLLAFGFSLDLIACIETGVDVQKPGLYVPEGSKTQQGESRSSVGDGGASWRRKALKRMQERSQMEDKSLEQIAEERGVNLDRLKQDVRSASSRRNRGATSHRFSNRPYLDDIHSHRREMKKPPSADRSIFTKKRERNREEGDERQSNQSTSETAASTLNKFPSDGSFLQMFAQASSERGLSKPLLFVE